MASMNKASDAEPCAEMSSTPDQRRSTIARAAMPPAAPAADVSLTDAEVLQLRRAIRALGANRTAHELDCTRATLGSLCGGAANRHTVARVRPRLERLTRELAEHEARHG